jgi:hypothetical protein
MSTTSAEGNTVTTNENYQTASTPEPEPVTPPRPDPVPYMMPQPDPTPVAEVEAAGETDAEVASQVDDDLETRADAYDESESQARTDDETETYDEVELETETYGQPELDGDGQAEPDLELALHEDPDTELAPETAATAGEPETLDLRDEVDLREASAEVATGERPFFNDADGFEERWNAIQTSFVDGPRHAVQSADRLVTEAMEELAKNVVSHRDSFQAQWRQGDDVDTEQLRVVFQGYRAFLVGLLST